MQSEFDPAATTPIDPSMAWESRGILAKSTGKGALFSLYLAMHQHSLAEPISIQSNDSDTKASSDFLMHNHYRRPALQMSDNDWRTIQTLTQLAATDFSAARLFQSLNPTPLAQTDNKFRLSDEIINNCSLGAQKRVYRQFSHTLKEDNTLLYDVLSAQHEENATQETVSQHDQSPFQFENGSAFA